MFPLCCAGALPPTSFVLVAACAFKHYMLGRCVVLCRLCPFDVGTFCIFVVKGRCWKVLRSVFLPSQIGLRCRPCGIIMPRRLPRSSPRRARCFRVIARSWAARQKEGEHIRSSVFKLRGRRCFAQKHKRCAIAQVRSPKARQQTRRSVADQALFRCYKMIFVLLITLSFTSYTLKPELDVLGVLLALFEHHH